MTSAGLLDHLTSLGVVMTTDGVALDLEGPDSAITPALVAQVQQNKPELIELVMAAEPEPAVVDFETRATVKLDGVGGRVYAAASSMEVICAVLRLPGGVWIEWCPGQPCPPELASAVANGTHFVAHNAHGFDKFIWQRLGWPEAAWIDTMHLARAAGLPASLDELAHVVLGERKDAAGKKVVLALGRTDRQTGRLPAISRPERAAVVSYCRRDVELTFRVWRAAAAPLGQVEPEVREVDRRVNDRGFVFDAELARGVIRMEQTLAMDAAQAAPVSSTTLSSPVRLRRWLADAGVTVSNVKAETLEDLLDNPDLPDDVARVLTARLMSSGIAGRKLRRALEWQSTDGRIRDTLAYHAAHTGRWTGRGFQPQNLPRIPDKLDENAAVTAVLARDTSALERVAADAGVRVEEALGACLRPCIIAPPDLLLAAVDYKQIEARALLWLAGDEQGLDVFRKGIDVYSEEAAHLFGVSIGAITRSQRQFGKAMTLGAGYGMGGARFSTYGESYGIDWSSSKFTPGEVIEAWRDRHPLVAGRRTGETYGGHVLRRGGLWRDVEVAARRALEGQGPALAGRCQWANASGSLVCTLPSGRKIFYREARVESVTTPWGAKSGITYAQRGKRTKTWGGKLVENIVQATCRDLLADALVRLESAGLPVVLHVHDEVVCEVSAREALAQIEAITRAGPPWAHGLPIDVEGYVARRYGVKLP